MLKNYFDESKYEEIKSSDNMLYKALEIATNVFENDTDKGGYPYILHLMSVYKGVNTYDEKVTALLHDLLEDKDVTKEDLLEVGIPEKIVNDVVVLTRDKVTEYQRYIEYLIDNASKEALEVKLADLETNLDLSRVKDPGVADFERLQDRYKPAYEKIQSKLNEMEK